MEQYNDDDTAVQCSITLNEDNENVPQIETQPKTTSATARVPQIVKFNSDIQIEKVSLKRRTSSMLDIFKSKTNHDPWPNYGRFVCCLIALSFNFENSYIFTFKMLENGGLTYLFCVLLLTFLYGIPMMFLEIYLGQFSAKGVTHCWNFAPVLRGIGFSMIMFNFFSLGNRLFIAGRILFYMANSLGNGMPWYYCMNTFNDNRCRDADEYDKRNSNLQSSLDQYWYMHVNFIQMINGTVSSVEDYASGMKILSFSVIVIIIFMMSYINWNIVSPIVYVMIGYPVVCYLILTSLGVSLTGKHKSIFNIIPSDFKKLISPKTWMYAMEFVIQSLNLGYGMLLTMSSRNELQSNIPLASFTVAVSYTLFFILQSALSMQTLRYIMNKHSLTIQDMKCYQGLNLIFVGITEMLGHFEWSNFWTFLYFTSLLVLSLGRIFASVEVLVVGFFDSYESFFANRGLQCLVFITLLSLEYSFGLLYTNIKGYYFYLFATCHTNGYNTFVLCFLESVAICYIYNFRNVTLDYKLISGHSLSRVWKILLVFVVPVLSTTFMIIKIWNGNVADFYFIFQKVETSRLTNINGYICSGIILSPVLIYAGFYFTQQLLNRSGTIKDICFKAIHPNSLWRPNCNYHTYDIRYSAESCKPNIDDTLIFVNAK